jgi:hypothetical protein
LLVNQFDLYDILSVIIPGGLATMALLYVQPYVSFSQLSSVAAVLGLTIISYSLGQLIQAFSQMRERKLNDFEKFMDPIWQGDESDDFKNNFWDIAKDRFDLSNYFTDSGRLLQLILSELESSKMVRANKMQALYAFHRNMWGVSQILSIVFVLSILTRLGGPFLDVSILIDVTVLVISISGWCIFKKRKNKFSSHFIDYTITDFYSLNTE